MRSPRRRPGVRSGPFTHLARWPNWFGPMQVPGTVAQLVRAPLTYMAWWVNSFRLNFTSPARLSQLCWGVTLSWHGGSRIQGPGGADRSGGGGGGHLEPGPQPGGGGAELAVLFGAGGAAGVDGGQALEPTGLEPVDLGLQLQGLFGQGGVGQPVEVLGEEGVDLGGVERISAADS